MTKTPVLIIHNLRCGGNAITVSAEDYLNTTYDSRDEDRWPIFKLGTTLVREYTWDDFLEEAPRGRKRFYSGHFSFGAARHIPGRVNYLTSVRDPEARLVSISKCWGNDVEDPDDWLRNHWEADNGMTRRLAGIGQLRGKAHDFVNGRNLCEEGEFKVTPEIFERAKAYLLENVAAVIVKERFVESMVLAEKKLGWPPMYSFSGVHFNHTPQIDLPASRDLMAEIVEGSEVGWNIELVDRPDPILAACRGPVVSTDSWILDRCTAWINLAAEIIDARIPGSRLVDLSC